MMLRVTARGTVFDASAALVDQRSSAFTSLTALHSRAYLASFRSAAGRDIAGGRLRIMGSDDGSQWETVHEGLTHTIDGVVGDMYSGYFTELTPGEVTGAFVWVDRSDSSLSFVHPETAGILPTRNLLAVSRDGGGTWSDWREVDLGPEQGCTVTGPVFEAEPGVLALPYETWKSYEDRSEGRHMASVRVSRDGGMSWDERHIVASDDTGQLFYWDQRLAVRGDTGEAVAMFWTHDRKAGRDIENHIAWAPAVAGEWSPPVACGWHGQHCQPLWLGGSELVAVYVERSATGGIRIRHSDDFGRTWGPPVSVFDCEPVSAPAGGAESFEEFWREMMTWQYGHPRAVRTREEDVLVIWYAGDEASTSVHWARVAAGGVTGG